MVARLNRQRNRQVQADVPTSVRWRHSAGTLLICAFALALSGMESLGVELPFADAYNSRGLITGASGSATVSNEGATVEPGEPRHDHKRGGHSVWVSWIAPTNGLATVRTTGSSFDTVLAVYAHDHDLEEHRDGDSPPAGTFDGLERVTGSDDDAGDSNGASVVQFGARAGVRYEIAIDGFAGATGQIVLTWSLAEAGQALPIVLAPGPDRAVLEGESVTLSAILPFGEEVELRWYLNDQPVDNGESSTLTIPNFRPQDVGLYKLRIKVGDLRFFSAPVEIQINSEGQSDALARDKWGEALDWSLSGGKAHPQAARLQHLQAPPIGVVRGYSGSQIFNTVSARRDPDEPLHCGVAGGASYWFAYTPTEDGWLQLDTNGSEFDTVLAVYAFDPPLTGYAGLRNVACDDNSGSGGLASLVRFSALRGQTYLVAMDGVNGARGNARLNYSFSAEGPPVQAPTIVIPPASQSVMEGQSAVFTVIASGSAPLTFQWRFNGSALPGETADILTLSRVISANAGTYEVTVSNHGGTVTSSPASLVVESPPALPTLVKEPSSQTVSLGARAVLSASVSGRGPFRFLWLKNGVPLTNGDAAELIIPAAQASDAGEYLVAVSNPSGGVLSSPAALRVVPPPLLQATWNGNRPTLSFETALGFRYVIESAESVAPRTWRRATQVEGTGARLVVTNLEEAVDHRFFRLLVE